MDKRALAGVITASLLPICLPRPAYAADVDVAIVFAVDVSASIDPATADIQRKGHVSAITAPDIMRAIGTNHYGCISITYLEWSSPGRFRVVLPWTDLCCPEDARSAAVTIDEQGDNGLGRGNRRATSISAAIEVASLLLDRFPAKATRKVIDISVNGENNDGPPLEISRSRAIAKGFTINAIAVPSNGADLYQYLRREVIGGPQSFALRFNAMEDYAAALRRKLVTEVSLN
jgi:hypothetical protein